jgi:hypothetical protein
VHAGLQDLAVTRREHVQRLAHTVLRCKIGARRLVPRTSRNLKGEMVVLAPWPSYSKVACPIPVRASCKTVRRRAGASFSLVWEGQTKSTERATKGSGCQEADDARSVDTPLMANRDSARLRPAALQETLPRRPIYLNATSSSGLTARRPVPSARVLGGPQYFGRRAPQDAG